MTLTDQLAIIYNIYGIQGGQAFMNTSYSDVASLVNNSKNSIHVEINELNSTLYQIKTPFQLTYIAYDQDLQSMNITTLSGKYSHQYTLHQSDVKIQHDKRILHFHDYFELVVILDGTLTQLIEDKEYHYPAGSCCLINRSLYHSEYYTDSARVLFIGFSVEFIRGLFEDCTLADFSQEKDILDSDFYKFIMDDLEHPGGKTYLDYIPAIKNQTSTNLLHDINSRLMDVLLHPVFGATHQVKGLFSLLISVLSDPAYFHCTRMNLEQTADALIFARISHFIEEKYGRISRDELSGLLNYSGDYINRIVHKFTGLCLFDYSMNFCMKKAAEELLYSQKAINEIAEELHFSNKTHFYKLFKEKYGITPKEFRANKDSTQNI